MSTLKVDNVNETTAGAGVTVDGVLCKDNEIASSYISFTQSGSDPATRTMQGKARDKLSVRDFKNDDGTAVAGDAVQDDTTGVLAAFTEAVAQDKALDFDGANCLISTAIAIPSGLRIVSTAGGLFHKAGALFGMLTITNVSDIVIDGLVIDGNVANVTSAADRYARSPVIEISASGTSTCDRIVIRNCEIKDFKGRGIIGAGAATNGSSQIEITDNLIHGGDSIGVSCADIDDLRIARNAIYSCVGAGIGVTASLRDTEHVVISNNVIKAIANDTDNVASGLGITLFSSGGFAVTDTAITGNVCDACESMGMSLTPGKSITSPIKLTVTGNTVEATQAVGNGSGISYEIIGRGVTFTGNVSRNPSSYHLATQRMSFSVVADNVFISDDASTITAGIVIQNEDADDDLTDIAIRGNTIINNTGVAATTRCEAIYFVDAFGGASYTDIVISDNLITGDWRYGIYNTTDTTGCDIKNNIIRLSDVTNLGTGIQTSGTRLWINGNHVEPKTTGKAIYVYAQQAIGEVWIFNNATYSTNAAYTPFEFALNGAVTINVCLMGGNVSRNANTSTEVIGRDKVTTLRDHGDNSWNRVTAVPASQYWTAGMRVYNGTPSVNGFTGWVCITSGTPGTWVAFGGIPAVTTTAVGNVGAGEDNLQSLSLPASTLRAAGSGVRITAWGTTANNSNPKTVKLYFGSAILTTALTVSQAGKWHIEALVFSTGTDTQDYVSKLNEYGTATQTDMENGALTEDDGAAVVIKCTGTVTDGGGGINNNDIVQEGLLVEALR